MIAMLTMGVSENLRLDSGIRSDELPAGPDFLINRFLLRTATDDAVSVSVSPDGNKA